MRPRDLLGLLACGIVGVAMGAACIPFQCPKGGHTLETEITDGDYVEASAVLVDASVDVGDSRVVVTYFVDDELRDATYEVIESSFD